MQEKHLKIFESKMDEVNLGKMKELNNDPLNEFLADAIELCAPDTVFVCSDDQSDMDYIRAKALETGEESKLNIEGHTIHFDGLKDQGRDPLNTKYLVPEGKDLGKRLRQINKDEGLKEVRGFLKDSMKGREMILRILCLGPINSVFSIPGVQVTDSFYVAHSENLLYRPGFEQFKKLADPADFFRVMHSAGRLGDDMTSIDVDKRRVFIDLDDRIVYSTNTQYAGNTVGFKKLCFRLAICKADAEGWLAEHMFVMGCNGPNGRKTYFTGAFPSFCGKTSTAMLTGETIVGDDLAYLRKVDGAAYAVNVEAGLFGIIKDVNPDDDPMIHEAITTPREVIFSNILIADGKPYWLGDKQQLPEKGVNFSGEWFPGKKDENGNEIPHAHKNARYTIRMSELDNMDEKADAPEGVKVGGIIYGGRDSDTWVPVRQSFNWAHGVVTIGASLESETTAATIGKEGVRAFQPMANLDFIAIPLGKYIQNHLDFPADLETSPLIFGVNYFLRDKDKFLNNMSDKRVWVKWMELRVNGEAGCLVTPTGLIPLYDDLKKLFSQVLEREYPQDDYVKQFTTRIPESMSKTERIEKIYKEQIPDTPQVFYDLLSDQKKRLQDAAARGGDYISPLDLEKLAFEVPYK